tara:strand:+ start:1125 stop:2870 length:1746 start_codon:yes stop_codon:yes gene_type:complete
MIINPGATNVTVNVYFVDSTSGWDSTGLGTPKTGLLFSNIETGGSASYQRQGAARVDFTLKTVAVAAAHDDGGFILIDDTNMPGHYRLDVPDAAFASGVDYVTIQLVAAAANNTVMTPITVALMTLDVNVTQISGDATAADNLEATYDGTGYSDDNAPATQAQLGAIAVTGSAVNIGAIASPGGFVLTTGSEVNDEDSTQALDSTRHELTDDAGTLDGLYKFDVGINGTPVNVAITGVFNGNNDNFGIYANSGTSATPVWQQVGTITGTQSAVNASYTFTLLSGQKVSDVVGQVEIRVYGTGLTSASCDIDQIIVGKSINPESVGYDDGAVWIDTVRGTAGTTVGTHGTVAVPSLTFADAITLAGNIGYGIYHLHLNNDSAITFDQDMSDWHITGDEYAVALGGQTCDKTSIHSAKQGVTGTYTGDIHMLEGKIGTAGITGPKGRIGRMPIVGPIVCDAAAGSFFIHNCWSSTTLCALDFGAAIAGKTNWVMDFWGVMEIRNLLAGDTLYLTSGGSRVTFASSCTGGTVNMSGTIEVINNGSGITFNDNAVINQTAVIDANVTQINSTAIVGDGSATPFGV